MRSVSGRSERPFLFFFFNDTATTEIYTLSLHDALPICAVRSGVDRARHRHRDRAQPADPRSEEHTSELQSQFHLVCRLLLEKKKGVPQACTNISLTTVRLTVPAAATTNPCARPPRSREQ